MKVTVNNLHQHLLSLDAIAIELCSVLTVFGETWFAEVLSYTRVLGTDREK